MNRGGRISRGKNTVTTIDTIPTNPKPPTTTSKQKPRDQKTHTTTSKQKPTDPRNQTTKTTNKQLLEQSPQCQKRDQTKKTKDQTENQKGKDFEKQSFNSRSTPISQDLQKTFRNIKKGRKQLSNGVNKSRKLLRSVATHDSSIHRSRRGARSSRF